MIKRTISIFLTAIIFMSTLVIPAYAANGGTEGTRPWMNTKLSAEERTELLLDDDDDGTEDPANRHLALQ